MTLAKYWPLLLAAPILIGKAGAECPTKTCYAVTFRTASCDVRESKITPPAVVASARGLLPRPEGVEARPIACDHSDSAVVSTAEEDARIVRERLFFFPTSQECNVFVNKVESFLASDSCCDPQHLAYCGVSGRLLDVLKIPTDIAQPIAHASIKLQRSNRRVLSTRNA